VEWLNREIVIALHTPDVRKALVARDFHPVGSSPEQFSAFVKAEVSKYARLVEQAGIKVDG